MNYRRNGLTLLSCMMVLSLTACGGAVPVNRAQSDQSGTEGVTVSSVESTGETTDSSKTLADLFSTEGEVFNVMCPDDSFYALVKTYDSDYADEGAWTDRASGSEAGAGNSQSDAGMQAHKGATKSETASTGPESAERNEAASADRSLRRGVRLRAPDRNLWKMTAWRPPLCRLRQWMSGSVRSVSPIRRLS